MDKCCWKRSYPVGGKNRFRCYSTLYSNGRDKDFWSFVTFSPSASSRFPFLPGFDPILSFSWGTIDQTLFIRRKRGDFILVQVYVDDIIFGSSNPQLCKEFEALMHEKFQMSAMYWSTARIETTDEGTKILATVDGKLRTVSESSIRRNIKLNDEDRISSLPDAELFEKLTLMCLSPKSTGFNEFSSNIATALVCLATNRVYNFSKMIFGSMVKNVNNKVSKFLMYPRFLSECLKMGQFGQITHTHMYAVPFHTKKIFTTLRVNSPSFSGRNVPLFPSMLVPIGEGSGTPTEPNYTPSTEAQQTSPTSHSSPSLPPVTTEPLPTVTPFDTPQPRQYTRRARIAQSSALPLANITKTSTLPSDSTPRVTSLAAGEGSMQHQIQELMALCTSLQRQHTEMASKIEAQELEITNLKVGVKLLEDREGGGIAQSGDDAPIKGRSLDEREEAAEKESNDTEEMVNVLTSLDAATVLSSGVAEVPTGSGSIPTAGPPATGVPTGSDVVPTASPFLPLLLWLLPTQEEKYDLRKNMGPLSQAKLRHPYHLQSQELDAQRINQVVQETLSTLVTYIAQKDKNKAKREHGNGKNTDDKNKVKEDEKYEAKEVKEYEVDEVKKMKKMKSITVNIMHGAQQGKDVIGVVEIGSGKTLAFGLPILQRLLEEREKFKNMSK
nr:putative ribonuclease H-like domain-containing protein [Tanacetum cinerariifolium]